MIAFSNTKKKVERVFFTNLEVFGKVVKHSLKVCDKYLLKLKLKLNSEMKS